MPTWQALTPTVLDGLRKGPLIEGGQLWICVRASRANGAFVVQADYVGDALLPGRSEVCEAFMTVDHSYIPASDVSHVMPFCTPALPDE